MSAIKLTIDAADWQKQVNAAVKVLEKLLYYFEDEKSKILEYAAIPMVRAMQAGAPMGSRIHYRYERGGGKRIAKYYPGNLRKSFRVLELKKTTDVIIGAKLSKGKGKGTFGLSRADAYYLHYVEYGTLKMRARPFVRPAIIQASPAVIRRVQLGCNLFAKKFASQNKG